LSDDSLSRRRRVQIEDLKGAVRLSSIIRNTKSDSSNVSFRHLALLAQTKSNDEQVWQSLGLNVDNPPSNILVNRLRKMRTWINSPHFPDEMRITVIDYVPTDMFEQISQDEIMVLENLTNMLANCQWDKDMIANCIVEAAKSIEKSPRISYTVSYICLMGSSKGPKLAPVMAELSKQDVIDQFRRCLDSLN